MKVEDINRRLDRKLEEVDAQADKKAATYVNFDRLSKESNMGFSYSEKSKLKAMEFSSESSGFKGFAINPTQIKNVNALQRLESLIKDTKMVNLIEDKLKSGSSKLVISYMMAINNLVYSGSSFLVIQYMMAFLFLVYSSL